LFDKQKIKAEGCLKMVMKLSIKQNSTEKSWLNGDSETLKEEMAGFSFSISSHA
jgi:hypothetical protein